MTEAATTPCAECQRLRAEVEKQRAQLEAQRTEQETQRLQVQQLQATVARLEEQLAAARKDSSTSSKPPSSDIVKPPPPPPPPGQTKRQRGGQPGHPKHERALFPQDQVEQFHDHPLSACPCCGGHLHLNEGLERVIQQVDLKPAELTIEQHTFPEYWCARCERTFRAELPRHIAAGGLVGPRLTALIAYLKGFCHASYSTIRTFLTDVVGLTISRGQLKKVIRKVSCALDEPYEELFGTLPDEDHLNVDETGHKDNGKRMWTWCFRASMYTLFKIDPYRSADVLIEVLGEEFNGVLGCDCFSAYRRYMRECNVVVQFCLAHLIRDVKFLTTLPGKADCAYGERLREALRELFGLIHRREQMTAGQFQRQLQAARERVLEVGTTQVAPGQAAQAMAKRLRKHGESYFTFVTTPGMEPTNNSAEQPIRFVVM